MSGSVDFGITIPDALVSGARVGGEPVQPEGLKDRCGYGGSSGVLGLLVTTTQNGKLWYISYHDLCSNEIGASSGHVATLKFAWGGEACELVITGTPKDGMDGIMPILMHVLGGQRKTLHADGKTIVDISVRLAKEVDPFEGERGKK